MADSTENITSPIENGSNNDYCKEVLRRINELRHEASFCDVILVVGGQEFGAHRLILAASSPYFRRLFISDMQEKNMEKICIGELCSSITEDLLTYLYTGAVQIDGVCCARNLVSAAEYLILPRLKKVTVDFLMCNITVSNCISLFYFAGQYCCKRLQSCVRKFIYQNFVPVARSEDFLSLDVDKIRDWISSDYITVTSEDDILEVVLEIVNHDRVSREAWLFELLKDVRLTLVSQQCLLANALDNELIRNIERCRNHLLEALQLQALSEDDISLVETPRKCLETHKNCLMVCGGHFQDLNQSSNVAVCFLPTAGKWYNLPEMHYKRTFHGVSTCQGYFYAVGGLISGSYTASVERYEPQTSTWIEVASMPSSVIHPGVASLCGFLYVVGGHNQDRVNQCLATVLQYNPTTDVWKEAAQLLTARAGSCVIGISNRIYAIGGRVHLGNSGYTNTVERLDVKRNAWSRAAPMREKRWHAAAAAVRDKIFVFGGRTDADRSQGSFTAEVYNTHSDYWQSITSMCVPRCMAGAVVVGGQIYVLGGSLANKNTEEEQQSVIECYNPETNERCLFECHVRHKEFLNFCCCAAVKFPKHIIN